MCLSAHVLPFITQDVVNDLLEPETAFTNARAGKYSLTPSFAVFKCLQALERLTGIQEHFEHFIKSALETVTVRLSDEITELQFLTKYQQEHQGKLCASKA